MTAVHSEPRLCAEQTITHLALLWFTLFQPATAWPLASAAEYVSLTGKD